MADTDLKIRNYEEIKTEAMSLRKNADGCDWGLGDLCVELDQLLTLSKIRVKEAKENEEDPDPVDLELTQMGKEVIKRLATDIGVGVEYLDARRRVSARIPKSGPLSWIRESSLSFTHCRALYPIKDDKELDAMAQKGLTLTVEQLRNEVAVMNDNLNIRSGLYECAECKSSIDTPENMFSIRKGRQTTLICSIECLCGYSTKLLEASQIEEDDSPVEFDETKDLAEIL